MKQIESAMDSVVTWLAVSFLGGIVWLVRRVFTNQQEIDLLKAELHRRDRQRDEDRELLSETRRGVERIEGWIVDGKPR